jgi:hypothetical protein
VTAIQPATTTPRDIITMALKTAGVIGVGQAPQPEDISDAFTQLNWLMSQWARKRYLVYRLQDVGLTSNGAYSYSVGPGGDFNLANRPDKIDAAYVRMNAPGAVAAGNSVLPVTPTGSPFVYVAPFNGTMLLSGGTVSAVSMAEPGGAYYPVSPTSPIPMGAGNLLQVVYTVAPTMTFTPDNRQVLQQTSPVAVTATGSPYVYTASAPGALLVTGGTVSAIALSVNGTTFYPCGVTSGAIPVQSGTLVRITYSVAPTLEFMPMAANTLTSGAVSPLNAVDYPIEVLQAREDYSRIAVKGLTALPAAVFYDPGFPLGAAYFYPVATASIYELHLVFKIEVSQFNSLSQAIILPPEYFAALHYTMADRLAAAYKLPPDPRLSGWAADALNVIRGANAAVPSLVMPAALGRNQSFNIYRG